MKNNFKTQIGSITIDDMRPGEDLLGDVIVDDGKESARNSFIWLVQQYFWRHPSIVKSYSDGKITKAMEQEILAHCKYMAINYLMNEWKDLGERTTLFALNDAQITGWHTSSRYNYQTLEELLASILEDQKSTVAISNWTFLIRELLPAAVRYGIDPDLLYGASTQHKKLRALVPAARAILTSDMSDNTKEEYLRSFLEKAADPTVKQAAFESAAEEIRDKKRRAVSRLVTYESIMPNGETWIIIRCPTPSDERTIEMLLEKKCDMRVTDWRAFTVLIAEMLKGFKDIGLDKNRLIPQLVQLLEGRKNGKHAEQEVEYDFAQNA